ncbi:MAG: C-GCAxxG-C-C family protein [Candidatus Saganbacteria bacterium]|nr:C-GCAxxG-C-C family protein [Candidatus Saganbacteria bacterium]
MKAKRAVEHFIGRGGRGRLNCAQSVAAVFRDEGHITDDEYAGLAGCGYGQAPNGYCGSAYAAMKLLGKAGEDKVEQFKRAFVSFARSLLCGEIRARREVKCHQTVKKSVELAEQLLGRKE